MCPYCSLELVIQKIGNLRKSYSPNICIDQPNIFHYWNKRRYLRNIPKILLTWIFILLSNRVRFKWKTHMGQTWVDKNLPLLANSKTYNYWTTKIPNLHVIYILHILLKSNQIFWQILFEIFLIDHLKKFLTDFLDSFEGTRFPNKSRRIICH